MFLFDAFIFAAPRTPARSIRDAGPPQLCHRLLPYNTKVPTPYTSSHWPVGMCVILKFPDNQVHTHLLRAIWRTCWQRTDSLLHKLKVTACPQPSLTPDPLCMTRRPVPSSPHTARYPIYNLPNIPTLTDLPGIFALPPQNLPAAARFRSTRCDVTNCWLFLSLTLTVFRSDSAERSRGNCENFAT